MAITEERLHELEGLAAHDMAESEFAGASAPTGPADDERAPLRTSRLLIAAFLGTAAAGWMVAAVFIGPLAPLVALLAAAAGVGSVGLALRQGRPWVQYLVAPAVFVLGYAVAILLPNPTGITGTVPSLVRAAIRNGGLSQPPIPFDPGWRFMAVVLLGLVGAAAASIAVSFRAPRAALLVPLPVVLAGALNQPKGHELLSGGVALVLLVAGLTVTYSAELAAAGGDAPVGRGFETRQLARGGAGIVAALVALAMLNQASLLFPKAPNNRQAKPQKPKIVALKNVKDRPLFDVVSTVKGPWRLGTLDEYDGSAWLLPPFDPKRTSDLGSGGTVSGGGGPGTGTGAGIQGTFTIRDLSGFSLPGLANPRRIEGARGDVGYDPRLQIFRARRGAPGRGFQYTVTAGPAPIGADIAARAGGPVPAAFERWVKIPPAPPAVVELLARAPANPWERLQFVRNALYEKVVAAGSGVPKDVPPARAVQLLRGGDATPFEIVATEAMLARWAGIPARIGYGFNAGTDKGAAGIEVRPKDGANWLEAYFEGFGWVPVLGVPPKARSSLSSEKKNQQAIKPSDRLSLQVYIPLQTPNPLLFFEVVRYWLARAIPLVAGAGAGIFVLAWPVKLWRRRQRRQWAVAHGPGGRIAVVYAEFRDVAMDLGVGEASSTPLTFLDRVAEDEEHQELAWLVTRALWGDLVRDVTDDDAANAEAMAASIGRRLARAQPFAAQGLALVSRASLREPYDGELPNPWPAPRETSRSIRVRLRRRRPAFAALMLVLAAGLTSCGGGGGHRRAGAMPDRLLPAQLGDLSVSEEPSGVKAFKAAGRNSMVAEGKVLTLRGPDGSVDGALEVGVLRPKYDTKKIDVRRGIRSYIETGQYRWFKVGGRQWVGVQDLAELRLYLWFPPRGDLFEVFQVRPQVTDAKQLVAAAIAYQESK